MPKLSDIVAGEMEGMGTSVKGKIRKLRKRAGKLWSRMTQPRATTSTTTTTLPPTTTTTVMPNRGGKTRKKMMADIFGDF